MGSPKCLVCQEDVRDKRSQRSMQGMSKEALLYTDALESYIQSKGLSLTAAELVAGAEGPAYICVKCGQTLCVVTKLKPQLDKINTCLTLIYDSAEQSTAWGSTPTSSTPTRSTPAHSTPSRSTTTRSIPAHSTPNCRTPSTPTRRRLALPTDQAPTSKRHKRDWVSTHSGRAPVLVVPFATTTRQYYLRTPSTRRAMVSLARGRHSGRALMRTKLWPSMVRFIVRTVVKEITQMNRSTSNFKETNLDTMRTFSWSSLWQQLRRKSRVLSSHEHHEDCRWGANYVLNCRNANEDTQPEGSILTVDSELDSAQMGSQEQGETDYR